jgi:hypothetical protein
MVFYPLLLVFLLCVLFCYRLRLNALPMVLECDFWPEIASEFVIPMCIFMTLLSALWLLAFSPPFFACSPSAGSGF